MMLGGERAAVPPFRQSWLAGWRKGGPSTSLACGIPGHWILPDGFQRGFLHTLPLTRSHVFLLMAGAVAVWTPSEVGGVCIWAADGLMWDWEGARSSSLALLTLFSFFCLCSPINHLGSYFFVAKWCINTNTSQH